jgi:hypothetical protein
MTIDDEQGKRKKKKLAFVVGDVVAVDGYDGHGRVAFIGIARAGRAEGKKRVGVIMNQPVGKCNGTVAGENYFQCGETQGVFVAASKVNKVVVADATTDKDSVLDDQIATETTEGEVADDLTESSDMSTVDPFKTLGRLQLINCCRTAGLEYKSIAKDVEALKALLRDNAGASGLGSPMSLTTEPTESFTGLMEEPESARSEAPEADQAVELKSDVEEHVDTRIVQITKVDGTPLGFSFMKNQKTGRGPVIKTVEPGSLADDGGFLPGDVVLSINSVNVTKMSVKKSSEVVKKAKVLVCVVSTEVDGSVNFDQESVELNAQEANLAKTAHLVCSDADPALSDDGGVATRPFSKNGSLLDNTDSCGGDSSSAEDKTQNAIELESDANAQTVDLPLPEEIEAIAEGVKKLFVYLTCNETEAGTVKESILLLFFGSADLNLRLTFGQLDRIVVDAGRAADFKKGDVPMKAIQKVLKEATECEVIDEDTSIQVELYLKVVLQFLHNVTATRRASTTTSEKQLLKEPEKAAECENLVEVEEVLESKKPVKIEESTQLITDSKEIYAVTQGTLSEQHTEVLAETLPEPQAGAGAQLLSQTEVPTKGSPELPPVKPAPDVTGLTEFAEAAPIVEQITSPHQDETKNTEKELDNHQNVETAVTAQETVALPTQTKKLMEEVANDFFSGQTQVIANTVASQPIAVVSPLTAGTAVQRRPKKASSHRAVVGSKVGPDFLGYHDEVLSPRTGRPLSIISIPPPPMLSKHAEFGALKAELDSRSEHAEAKASAAQFRSIKLEGKLEKALKMMQKMQTTMLHMQHRLQQVESSTESHTHALESMTPYSSYGLDALGGARTDDDGFDEETIQRAAENFEGFGDYRYSAL